MTAQRLRQFRRHFQGELPSGAVILPENAPNAGRLPGVRRRGRKTAVEITVREGPLRQRRKHRSPLPGASASAAKRRDSARLSAYSALGPRCSARAEARG